MRKRIELVVTPPARFTVAGLDQLAPLRDAFARGPVDIVHAQAESWWFRRFGVAQQADWPAAAFRPVPGTGDTWRLCADPVNLRIEGDHVVLDSGAAAGLAAAEAAELVRMLDAHFAADGFGLRMATPREWVLVSNTPLHATTSAPARAHGRSIETFLASGDDGPRLRRIATEAQMILHDCAVNQEREARGQWPVNGLWLWGGAGSVEAPRPAPGLAVLSDACHVRGLAGGAGASVAACPADAGALAGSADDTLVDLDGSIADPAAWAADLVQRWLEPLRAVQADRWLTLLLPETSASARLFVPDPWRLLRRGGLAHRLAGAGTGDAG